MEKPKSVALISAGYPPHMFGGIDVQTYDLAHALSSEKVNVTVFCGGSKFPSFIRENDYLKVCRLPMIEIPPRVIWFQLQNIKFFAKELTNYDLVHTQHSSGSVYGLLKKKIGKPWIVSFHDHQLRRCIIPFKTRLRYLSPKDVIYYMSGYPIFELLTKMELKWADHYVVCGKSGFLDYVRFSKMDSSKTTLIPNGVNLEKIQFILQSFKKEEEQEDEDDLVIFTCGRLYSSKGIHFLLKAMPFVLERFPNAKLKIFGRGPLYSKLLALIKQLNLQGKVCLKGHVPYERLINEMSRCTLAVFPSMIEVGPSLAVMEAMACKKAVIAYRYPFSAEIIQHLHTGYLVTPMHIKELAEAICLLLEDEKMRNRLAMNAYLHILANHDIRKVVKKYLQVYSKCLSG